MILTSIWFILSPGLTSHFGRQGNLLSLWDSGWTRYASKLDKPQEYCSKTFKRMPNLISVRCNKLQDYSLAKLKVASLELAGVPMRTSKGACPLSKSGSLKLTSAIQKLWHKQCKHDATLIYSLHMSVWRFLLCWKLYVLQGVFNFA